MNNSISTITDDSGNALAIVIPHNFNKDGITFCTPNEYSEQLAYMHHPTGKKIEPHVHHTFERHLTTTQEVLIIKSGKLRVDFYLDNKEYLKSIILNAGDVILLVSGGHGFEVLEELEMIEVKQGPYAGELDKERFTPLVFEPVYEKNDNMGEM